MLVQFPISWSVSISCPRACHCVELDERSFFLSTSSRPRPIVISINPHPPFLRPQVWQPCPHKVRLAFLGRVQVYLRKSRSKGNKKKTKKNKRTANAFSFSGRHRTADGGAVSRDAYFACFALQESSFSNPSFPFGERCTLSALDGRRRLRSFVLRPSPCTQQRRVPLTRTLASESAEENRSSNKKTHFFSFLRLVAGSLRETR